MKFPITRESLQAYDYVKEQEKLKEEEIQKRLMVGLEWLCKDFKKSMSSNSKEKKYVWRDLQSICQIQIPGFNLINDECLSRFIEKLKELFIGCDIIIDPLKTYLIIDWS